MEQFRMTTTRRGFVAGAAGISGWGASRSGYDPKLMVQPYVWTQQFRAEKIGLAEGLEKAIPACRRAGYRRMQIMDSFLAPDVRERAIGLLRQYNFDVPVVYQGGTFHDAEAAEGTIAQILATADAAKELRSTWINTNCNPKAKHERKTDAELATEARYLNRLGEHLKQRGMRLMLHQHDPDMQEGAREWRSNLHHTDPKLVWFCVDVHWVLRGKQDPMTLLKEAGQRIADLHLRNSVNGIWSESLGDGEVDYRAVAKFMKQIKYQGYLSVELAYEKGTDPKRPLEEDLKISREYAEKMFELT
jgi:inosose dehydratase